MQMAASSSVETSYPMEALEAMDKDNKLLLTLGNFAGGVGATTLVGFSVAMNQVMEGRPIHITGANVSSAGLFYLRYVPIAVLAASGLSFYGTSPLIQKYAGMSPGAANQVALGSIGPLLGPLYARQEGGITLVTLFKMSQTEAIHTLQRASRIPGVAPGTLFTTLRNTVSLGVGGALAADGGEGLQRVLYSEKIRTEYPVSSKVGGSVLLGMICGGMSGVFEFMRIAKVISAAKSEPFSITKSVTKLMRERNFPMFFALRCTHIGLFYGCFVGGQEIARRWIG